MFQDLRYALRQLLKSPGFTAVAVLTLALGIGANTAIFSVVERLLLSPLPYTDSGRMVLVSHGPFTGARRGADGGTFLDWRDHSTCFEALAAVHAAELNLSGVAEPVQLSGYAVSADYFRVYRLSPVLGRGFTPADDAAGGDNDVVVLSHQLWQRRLGADPAILGKTVRLDGRAFTVVGVLGPDALPGEDPEFLIPTAIEAAAWKQLRDYNYVCTVVGRLKPGATFAQAQAELVAANNSLRSLYPPNKSDWTVTVESLHEASTDGTRLYLGILMATVGLVLLIACANVANLLLARAATRQTEIAVRVALGASAGRIVRLLLVESIALSLLGGAAGLFVASFAIGPLVSFCAADLLPGLRIGINTPVLLFTLGVSVATGILFGLAPALRIARPDVTRDLKECSRGAVGGSRHRLQRVFIVAETGLTVVLLFTAGLLLRSFIATLDAETGFDRSNIVLFDLNRASDTSPTPAHRVRFIEAALHELRARPGIVSAGMISAAPFNDRRFYGDTIRRSEDPDPRSDIQTGFDGIAGDIFQTLGAPLLRGRFLAEADSAEGAAKVLLVNQTLARRLFGAEEPLGRHVRFKNLDWEVVGLVGDISRARLDAPPPPMVYLPTIDFPWTITLAVRTPATATGMAATIRRAIAAVDPDQPVANLRTMEESIGRSATLRVRRMMLTLVGTFAGIALLLACVGLYGVMAYSVTQRTREIGVRLALGADANQVRRAVVRGGLGLVGVGLALGALASVPAGFGVGSQVFGMRPVDFAVVFAVVAGALLAVAVLACWIPARRATRIDPMAALRAE